MNRVLITLLIAVLCSIPSLAAAQTTQPADVSPYELETVAQEFTAAVETGNFSAVERLLSSTYVGVDINGNLLDREGRLRALKNADLKLASSKESAQHLSASGTTAVVTGIFEISGSLNGKDITGSYRYVDVWSKLEGKWRVIATTMTRIAEPAVENK